MTIIKGKTTYDGLIEIDGELACEGCKTINPPCKLSMHMDFTDKFMNSYNCVKCGNGIAVTTKRNKGSMWEE